MSFLRTTKLAAKAKSVSGFDTHRSQRKSQRNSEEALMLLLTHLSHSLFHANLFLQHQGAHLSLVNRGTVTVKCGSCVIFRGQGSQGAVRTVTYQKERKNTPNLSPWLLLRQGTGPVTGQCSFLKARPLQRSGAVLKRSCGVS